jgi:hypothetical protein
MHKEFRKTKENEIVRMYLEDHKSAGIIATEIGGMTRQNVWKILRKKGVDTRKEYGTRVKVNCEFCNKDYELTRSRWRVRGKHNFCSHRCYMDYFRTTSSYYWREGTRIGRLEIYPLLEKVYGVIPEFVIHHKDGDDRNNEWGNLMAFPGQSDHLKYHRGSIASVLLDGANFGKGRRLSPTRKQGVGIECLS